MSTRVQRGQVAIVNFAPTKPNARIRPALVIQNDRDNQRMTNTIVAQITSNVSRAHESTQLRIDQSHRDWTSPGLRLPSVVNCSSLATVDQRHITRTIGSLSQATMEEIKECLKEALEIR